MSGPPLSDHKQKPAKEVQNKNFFIFFFFEAQIPKESIFAKKKFSTNSNYQPPQTVAQAKGTFFKFLFTIPSHPPNQWPPNWTCTIYTSRGVQRTFYQVLERRGSSKMVLIGSEAKRGGSWLSVWQPTFDFGQIFPILLRMIIGIMEKKNY